MTEQLKKKYYRREYHMKNREKRNESNRQYRKLHRLRLLEASFNYRLKLKYKMSRSIYEAMVKQQNGACYLCGTKDMKRRLDVDHSHINMRVRKLLCTNCNRGLGLFGDCPEILRKAADYIESFSAPIPHPPNLFTGQEQLADAEKMTPKFDGGER